MSRYDYAGTYGKPVSVVCYDVGPGTRTYVTRVEERVQQARRPSTMGYSYYSAMNAEKESRPREVDNFITKLLDEVNGTPTVSTTTWSSESVRDPYGLPAKANTTKDYGVGYKFGDDSPKMDGRRGYYVEYTYVGSRNYGDPYDYGVPNGSDNSRLKSETPRDYQTPKTRWETSSRPNYDVPPWYRSSKSYGEEPEFQRVHEVPDNQLKSEMAKDYGVPKNQWNTSSVKPVSPKPYGGSEDQWGRPLKPVSVQQPPNSRSVDIQGDYSPSKPTYQTRPYEDTIGDRDRYRGNSSSLKPQPFKNYGVSDNQGGRSSSPNYGQQTSPSMKPQSREASAVPKNYRGRSPSPEYEHPPRNNLLGGVAGDRWGSSPLKTQSTRDYGTPDNPRDSPSSPIANKGDGTPYGREDQKEGSTSPEYEHPPRNDITRGVPSNRWSDSPLNQRGSPSSPVANKGDRDRSVSPEYEHPPRNDITRGVPSNRWSDSPLNQRGSPSSPVYSNAPQDANREQKNELSDVASKNRGTQGRSTSPAYEHPPRNEILARAPSSRWDNTPVRPDSPRDHGSSVNQLGNPSSPVYNAYNDQKNVQPNVANYTSDPEPKGDYGGGSTMKPSNGYQASPLSHAGSRDSSGQQSFSGGVSSSQPKYSIYSAPVSRVVTVRPGVTDSMGAQGHYGNFAAPSRSYNTVQEEYGKPVITSRDALKKYNGSFF